MLRAFVAIGAGFLLSVALLRMLPEALELEPAAALPLVVCGYFLTHLFEHALVPHFHFGEEVHAEFVHRRASRAAILGLCLHSFFDGVSIVASYAVAPVLGWLVFGLVVGALAKLVMPGHDPGGIIVTMLLGITGALLGGFVGRALGWNGPNDGAGFLMSLLGAVLLLMLYRMSIGRRAQT